MRCKWSVADAELLEPDTFGEHIEEPHPTTEKVGREMDEDLIDEAGPQCLLPGRCAAKLDVLVARRGFRLPYRALDPVSDEGEIRRPFGNCLGGRRIVGQHEYGHTIHRMPTAPSHG